MTVEECVKQSYLSKIWLCPNIVYNSKITPDPLLCGISCTKTTVPEELRQKEVASHRKEADTECIIWSNEDQSNPPYGGL